MLTVTDIPRPSKGRAGKTVRIISPHSASEDAAEHHIPIDPPPRSASMRTSPPPTSFSPPSGEDEIISDPVRSSLHLEREQIEDPQTYSNTLANQNDPPTSPQASTLSADPFKETARASGSVTRTEESTTQEVDSKSHRPHYDVDDFKKLLLTGEKPRHAEQKPAGLAAAASVSQSEVEEHENSSENASVFQAPSSPAISSFNRTGGDTRTRADTDKGQESLASYSSSTAERAKPAAPKPRHGKLVTPAAPQTVSFEDPAFSHASGDDPIISDLRRPATRDQTPRSPSQRPLPSLPRVNSNPTPLLRSRTVEDVSSPASERRPVPHPPPARRHGATRPTSSLIDSTWSTQGQQAMAGPTNPLSQQMDDPKPAPPPPRRSGRARNDSLSALPTTTSSDQSVSSATGSISTPPSQSPSLLATGKSVQTSPHAASPSMPPPPPPPRRRGSSQGSYTPSRLSGDYRQMVAQRPRGDSGASSISQLQMTPEESGAERKDVLADLSALQREVDELRGKIR